MRLTVIVSFKKIKARKKFLITMNTIVFITARFSRDEILKRFFIHSTKCDLFPCPELYSFIQY